jgi:hypothetical protein
MITWEISGVVNNVSNTSTGNTQWAKTRQRDEWSPLINTDGTKEIPNNINLGGTLCSNRGWFIDDGPLKRGFINDTSMITHHQTYYASPVLTSLNDRADWLWCNDSSRISIGSKHPMIMYVIPRIVNHITYPSTSITHSTKTSVIKEWCPTIRVDGTEEMS